MFERKENDRILEMRNETSLAVDDLAALVVNSALADDLRRLSEEIMEMNPGFAFTARQARELRDLTRQTLKQYAARAARNETLMDYCSRARTILKGDYNSLNGGVKMGLLNNLLHGKENRQKETLLETERQYREICNRIQNCQEEMSRAIRNSTAVPPNSQAYRNNERAYSRAKEELKLLTQNEAHLSRVLESAGRIELLKQFRELQKDINKKSDVLLGSDKDRGMLEAGAELEREKTRNKLDKLEGFGSSIFDAEEEGPRTNSEFGAAVAERARLDAVLEGAGVAVPEAESSAEPDSFAAMVNAAKENGGAD